VNGAGKLARGIALALCLCGCLVAASCYRAEIELGGLMESSGGTSAQPAGGSSGASDDAEAGEAGAPGDVLSCDPGPLDPEQVECQKLGRPTAEECSDFGGGNFDGCYAGACLVCTKSVRRYPYYFQWHPCCGRNPTCYSNSPKKCDKRCPQPSERDKHPRCAATNPRSNLSLEPD
jgi:hypothetical protein